MIQISMAHNAPSAETWLLITTTLRIIDRGKQPMHRRRDRGHTDMKFSACEPARELLADRHSRMPDTRMRRQ